MSILVITHLLFLAVNYITKIMLFIKRFIFDTGVSNMHIILGMNNCRTFPCVYPLSGENLFCKIDILDASRTCKKFQIYLDVSKICNLSNILYKVINLQY